MRALSDMHERLIQNFPSFSEGLSLRDKEGKEHREFVIFPFLFGGTFIEGPVSALRLHSLVCISLPFRRDFH